MESCRCVSRSRIPAPAYHAPSSNDCSSPSTRSIRANRADRAARVSDSRFRAGWSGRWAALSRSRASRAAAAASSSTQGWTRETRTPSPPPRSSFRRVSPSWASCRCWSSRTTRSTPSWWRDSSVTWATKRASSPPEKQRSRRSGVSRSMSCSWISPCRAWTAWKRPGAFATSTGPLRASCRSSPCRRTCSRTKSLTSSMPG